jgi:hypothetical protein
MIQRIQSVYLLLAVILMVLLYSNPIAEIVVRENLFLTQFHNKIVAVNDESFIPISTWPVTVLLSVIVLLNLSAILLYKNRQLQIRFCIFSLLLMFGLIGLVFFFTKTTLSSMEGLKSVFLWPFVCPMVAIILNYLAFKSIQKDERLVRSYERIR